MRFQVPLLVLALSMPAAVFADQAETEIEHLISTVGESGCTFIRNGSRHDAADAASHMRLTPRLMVVVCRTATSEDGSELPGVSWVVWAGSPSWAS